MRISIGVICHYGVGGSARVAVDLTRELAHRGHNVHLLARAAPFGALQPDSVTLHTLHDRPMTTTLDADWCAEDLDAFTDLVCDLAQREGLDLLHFHYAIPFLAIARAVQTELGAAAPRIVLTLHGTDVSVFGQRPGTRAAVARGLRDLHAITTVSQSHAALAVEVFGLDEPPHVIPNFVNTDAFRPARPHTGRPRIAYVSNFREIKQPEAMARIVDETLRHVDAEVWLVGDGERMPAVESLLLERESRGQVRKFGVRLDLESILPLADVVLVTSQTESFSLVALEAMASGVPVVAPRVGGMPELIEHARSGLLFQPGDEAEAVRRLTQLVSQPVLRRRMGAEARRKATQLSSVAVVPRYEQLYRDLLSAASVARPVRVRVSG
jgi:L-malate glycosyltransferase